MPTSAHYRTVLSYPYLTHFQNLWPTRKYPLHKRNRVIGVLGKTRIKHPSPVAVLCFHQIGKGLECSRQYHWLHCVVRAIYAMKQNMWVTWSTKKMDPISLVIVNRPKVNEQATINAVVALHKPFGFSDTLSLQHYSLLYQALSRRLSQTPAHPLSVSEPSLTISATLLPINPTSSAQRENLLGGIVRRRRPTLCYIRLLVAGYHNTGSSIKPFRTFSDHFGYAIAH
jgi:hypothetical protein